MRLHYELSVIILLGWGLSGASCFEAAYRWRVKTGNEFPYVLGVCALAPQDYGTHNASMLDGIAIQIVQGSKDKRVPVRM